MSNLKERRIELVDYVKHLLKIYYNKSSQLYKDKSLRYMVNKAKLEIQIVDFQMLSQEVDSEREKI